MSARQLTLAVTLACVAALAACGTRVSRVVDYAPPTGVNGIVTVGPTCPVERAGSPCPDRPIVARITASTASGRIVARTRSSGNGRFFIMLPPGTYVLAVSAKDAVVTPRPLRITVRRGFSTPVHIRIDSGIR